MGIFRRRHSPPYGRHHRRIRHTQHRVCTTTAKPFLIYRIISPYHATDGLQISSSNQVHIVRQWQPFWLAQGFVGGVQALPCVAAEEAGAALGQVVGTGLADDGEEGAQVGVVGSEGVALNVQGLQADGVEGGGGVWEFDGVGVVVCGGEGLAELVEGAPAEGGDGKESVGAEGAAGFGEGGVKAAPLEGEAGPVEAEAGGGKREAVHVGKQGEVGVRTGVREHGGGEVERNAVGSGVALGKQRQAVAGAATGVEHGGGGGVGVLRGELPEQKVAGVALDMGGLVVGVGRTAEGAAYVVRAGGGHAGRR